MARKLSFKEFNDRVYDNYFGRLVPYEDSYCGLAYKVKVHCNIHNIDFETNAYTLSVGKSNCPLCYSENMRDVQLLKRGIYEIKPSELTEEYVLDILKNNSISIIRKSYKNVYNYLLNRYPKPSENCRLCSEVLIYMIEHQMKKYPVDRNGNYLTDSGFIYYIVKDTDEIVDKQYVLKCLKDVSNIKSLKIHYPKAYDYLFDVLYPIPNDYTLKIPSASAFVYMIEHNYNNYPKSPITGEYVRFVNSEVGFFLYSKDKSETPTIFINENKDDNPDEFGVLLKNSILNIYDINGKEVKYNTLDIKYEKRFSFEQYNYYIYLDGEKFTIGDCKVKYKCRCGEENIIYLKKYLKKTKITCPSCFLSFEYGNVSCHSKYHKNENTLRTINDKLSFDDMSDEFKEDYKNSHITEDEFYNNLKYFVQVNSHKVEESNIKNIIFKYAVPNNNQHRFSTKVSFDNGVTFETLKEIYLRCSVCGKVFRVHISNIRKKGELSSTKCNSCNFCNYTYEVKRYDDSSDLTYLSNLEKYFIDRIKEFGYQILNGLEIEYFYRHINKNRKYFVDFYLPLFKTMVEIKGENKFYRDDLQTGKFDDKCLAARQYAEENNMKYVVLFENDIDEFINNLTLNDIVSDYPTMCPLF